MRALLERLFRLRENGTTPRTELLGGATTFLTMAYIIVVNPAILQAAGLPVGPSTVATVLAAVFGCLLMGLYANRPLAVAPYMGENAFIAFGLTGTVVAITPQQRLGSVFVAGAAFLVLTLLGLRTWLAGAVSASMKHAFAAGIGLFLLFIGMVETGIVVKAVPPAVPLTLGNLRDVRVLLAIAGFLGIAVLYAWNVRGGVLIGIVVVAAAGYLCGVGQAPQEVFTDPWSGDYNLGEVAFTLDIRGVLQVSFLPILLTLFLISFLDTLGTLVGVGAAGGMLDEKGNFKDVQKPMLVDAASCMFSAVVGTSTSGAFIESAAGIREGARTGLAAVTTGLLFALALLFLPLFQPLQQLKYAYGPALMAVGLLMVGSMSKINFDDLTEATPAVATIALMVFSYNIANGLTAGLVLYPLIKLLTGRWREVTLGHGILAGLCLVYFVFGLPH
jgi:AGZA family xanthine/uracil permease-like MFS transporter